MSTRWLIVLLVLLAVVGGVYWYTQEAQAPGPVVGGERDSRGCLIAAGYAFDADVGACIRAFEMTEDIKQAAGMAVVEVGQGWALTVVAFNSYEEVGAYDIMFERGAERTKETVYIRGGQVVPAPTQ